MLTEDHARTALSFLPASDRAFASGDRLQASEKLWGAATHALTEVVMRRGRRLSSHSSFNDTAERRSDEHHDPSIEYGFAHAERFHRNFYHDDMMGAEVDILRPRIQKFVNRVPALTRTQFPPTCHCDLALDAGVVISLPEKSVLNHRDRHVASRLAMTNWVRVRVLAILG